jgi:Bacteriophage CII protein.
MINAHSYTSSEKLTAINKRAQELESKFINEVNIRGTEAVARVVGVDRSQMSKWKRTHFPKFARFLALIDVEPDTSAMKELAKELVNLMGAECHKKALGCSKHPRAVMSPNR